MLETTPIEVVESKSSTWEKETNIKEQLGIPDSDYSYHILNSNQSRQEEVSITRSFLRDISTSIPSSTI